MSVFLLLISLVKEIERVVNAYLWCGGNTRSKGIKWRAWDHHLCNPKKWGEIGFQKLSEFNFSYSSNLQS